MCAAASTEAAPGPLARAAARGELPWWAEVSEGRREHIGRVAALLGEWADALGLPEEERTRWLAAGWLHDALRDADPERLRDAVPEGLRSLPGKLLHGPAAAERLAGAVDPELADAVRFHTIGSPRFGRLGRALYLADFLEPGRDFLQGWTAALRARMPMEMDQVLREVLEARIAHVSAGGGRVFPETQAFHEQVTRT